MRHGPTIIGATVGAFLAMITLELHRPAAPPETFMISECGGAIRQIVIHYIAGDAIALPVYQSFLPQLPSDVLVHVLCPDRNAFDELTLRIGKTSCRLSPVITGHPMTVWSRDRWIALGPASPSMPTTLLTPVEEQGAEIWPERAGDQHDAEDLARALPQDVVTRRIPLLFDGGDFLADGSMVFATPALLAQNLDQTVHTRQQLSSLLSQLLPGNTVILNDAPDHHAGMYMMAAGNHTMVVGDPSLGRSLYSSSFPQLPDGPDFSPQAQHQFDSVATQLAALGYRIVRMPTLLSPDGKTYLTYVNVITDHRNGHGIVYMPVYRGAEAMNESAAQVWSSLGYEVAPIDCTSSYRHFGNLHCLVNVLRRD